ncbi:MAG: hypothetical protein WKF91_05275 [Segetibacter sp.]
MDEKELEDLIHTAQKWICSITAVQLNGNKKDLINEILFESARDKLFAYGLIETDNRVKNVYPLTNKGIHFKSFKDENLKHQKEAYLKNWAYLRSKKYWLIIALVTYLMGILTPILIERLKSNNQVKSITIPKK